MTESRSEGESGGAVGPLIGLRVQVGIDEDVELWVSEISAYQKGEGECDDVTLIAGSVLLGCYCVGIVGGQ